MPRKNRAARLSDFRQGVTIWEVNYNEVRPRMCMGRPFKPSLKGLSDSWAVDFRSPYSDSIDHEFLSDAGVPGHAYDSRPPRFYMSRGAALRALPILQAYSRELDRIRDSEDPDWWDDEYYSYDYDEPSVDEAVSGFYHDQQERGTYTARTSDLRFKYDSDHKAITFRLEGDSTEYLGFAIDSVRIRVDYAFDSETQELTPYSLFLLLHKGQWCNTEGSEAWRIVNSASPAQCKRAVALLTPLGPQWQEALNKLTVTRDEPEAADDTRFALAP